MLSHEQRCQRITRLFIAQSISDLQPFGTLGLHAYLPVIDLRPAADKSSFPYSYSHLPPRNLEKQMKIPIVLLLLGVLLYSVSERFRPDREGGESMSKQTIDLGKLSIALKVADIEKSVEFYTQLGFEPEHKDKWNQDYAIFKYRDFTLQLMTFIPQTMLVNLAQKDQASVDATWKSLADRGVQIGPAGPPGGKNKGAIMQDPDGNSLFMFAEAPTDLLGG